MLKILKTRFKQGCRTMRFPKAPAPALPPRYRGRPIIAGQRVALTLGKYLLFLIAILFILMITQWPSLNGRI